MGARTGSRRALMAVYAWNGLRILDFVAAITIGFLSSPSRIQVLALDLRGESDGGAAELNG
jgi:hypothetical protein